MALPLAAIPVATGVISKGKDIIDDVGDFFGGIFGGGPKDDWAKVAAGQVGIPNTSLPVHLYVDLPQEYRSITQVSPSELFAAIESAPTVSTFRNSRGSWGTAADLRAAVTIPNKEAAPYVGTNQQLALVAAYAAHGGVEGPTHWSNIPAGEHVTYMIGEYRKRQASVANRVGGAIQGATGMSALPLAIAGLGLFFTLRK